MRYFLLFILLSFSINIYAQKHDYIWTLGYSSGLPNPYGGTQIDFNTIPTTMVRHDRQVWFGPTVGSMCDSLGNLLFYSNGNFIADKNDDIMPNGDSLNMPSLFYDEWGYVVPQGMIILPSPQNPKKYFFFHLRTSSIPTNPYIKTDLLYTLVDMELNNGNGDVVEKNKPVVISELSNSHLTACKHANGRDWWVIMPQIGTNIYHYCLLTPNGVEGPWQQSIGNNAFGKQNWDGMACFSPDGSKYLYYDPSTDIFLFDFNRCTGLLSNFKYVPIIDNADSLNLLCGAVFSPNSRFLYIITSFNLYQFDSNASDLNNSKILIDTYDGFTTPTGWHTAFYMPVVAPDGKIYIGCASSLPYMHRINEPNKKGIACDFRQHSILLPTIIDLGMPHFPNYRLGPIDGSTCDTLRFDNHPLSNWLWDIEDSTQINQVNFTDNASYEPTSWHWNFGDGTMSQDTSPVHTYAQNGVYYVCLTVCNANSCDTLCRDVYVGVSGVEEIADNQANEIIAYPNPAADILYLKLPISHESQLQIMDLTGKIVLQKALSQNAGVALLDVNIVALPVGMYVLTVRDGHGLVGVKKVVISRD
jgi:hypothetical protein